MFRLRIRNQKASRRNSRRSEPDSAARPDSARLASHVELLLAHEGRPIREILGAPDDLKLRSCLTLFALAARHAAAFDRFAAAIDEFHDGEWDEETLKRLEANEPERPEE